MTELDQAQADAEHARRELQKARMLLARWQGGHEADVFIEAKRGGCALSLVTPSQAALYLETCKFQRETSQFPKREA